jgi:hypothetical protein
MRSLNTYKELVLTVHIAAVLGNHYWNELAGQGIRLGVAGGIVGLGIPLQLEVLEALEGIHSYNPQRSYCINAEESLELTQKEAGQVGAHNLIANSIEKVQRYTG